VNYVNLGNTGLKVSRLCMGCMSFGSPTWQSWILEEEESRPYLRRALDEGINFFDTADIYSRGRSEEILGKALADFGVPRHEVVIATKLHARMGADPNNVGQSRKHVFHAIDESLRRLRTDHVDLYQIHRFDYDTPMEEVLEALNDVVRAGKVRYLGASSMWTWQFQKMIHISRKNGWARFVSMQNHYNLIYREEEREMIPFCRSEGVGIIPWSPLARGRLTRNVEAKTVRSTSDAGGPRLYDKTLEYDNRVIDRLNEIAKERAAKPATVALAWMLHKPGITAPIIGATKPHHMDDAIAAEKMTLSGEEMRRLEEFYVAHPVAGHE
jgi:aryl-alcohol dehydrogenase-like predicted oxidoreductase